MKHACQWSSPARLVFLYGKQLGGSSTIGGSSAMVLLLERHLSHSFSLIQPFPGTLLLPIQMQPNQRILQ